MGKMVAIVGMCGSGKSIASEYYEKRGYKKVYFGGVTMKKLKEEGLEITPDNERIMREKLRKDYGMGAYALLLLDEISYLRESSNVVLDGLYSWDELKILKEKFNDLKIVSIVVDKEIRYSRLKEREIRSLSSEEANIRDITEIENIAKGGPIAYADYYIVNNGDLNYYYNELDRVTKIIEGD